MKREKKEKKFVRLQAVFFYELWRRLLASSTLHWIDLSA